MKIVYNKISSLVSKDSFNSIVTFKTNHNSYKISERFIITIDFPIEKESDFSKHIKYGELLGIYYVLASDTYKKKSFFGFRKVNGTIIQLIKKEILDLNLMGQSEASFLQYNTLMGISSYSHSAFLSDDLSTFEIQENLGKNKDYIKLTNPIKIDNPTKLPINEFS